MPRTSNVPGRGPAGAISGQLSSKPAVVSRSTAAQDSVGTFWDMLAFRAIFTLVCTGAGYHFRPFGFSARNGAIAGFSFAIAVVLFELRLRKASLRRLIGAAV